MSFNYSCKGSEITPLKQQISLIPLSIRKSDNS